MKNIDLGDRAEWSKPFISSCLYMDRCVVDDQDIGWGVFTSEFIKKSTMIEVAPVVVLDCEQETINDYVICNYILSWKRPEESLKKIALPFGWTMHYNHSDNNSCAFAMNTEQEMVGIMSLRDISPNEQITVNYGVDWFTSRNIVKLNI